jgi:hypothetical protein
MSEASGQGGRSCNRTVLEAIRPTYRRGFQQSVADLFTSAEPRAPGQEDAAGQHHELPGESPGAGMRARGPGLAMKSGRGRETRKEHAMMFAFPLAIVGLIVIKTLELVANHG